MYCQNRVVHKIQEGDSLYKLARQYHTTVTELILLNAGVNPYNLQIGKKLTICPGEGYEAPNEMTQPGMPGMGETGSIRPGTSMPGGNTSGGNEILNPSRPMNSGSMSDSNNNEIANFIEKMRLAWLNHIIWTRFYLISSSENLPNTDATLQQLMKNINEIVDAFANNYSPAALEQLKTLLTEHVQITGKLIEAQKNNNIEAFNRILPDWYENADRIAVFLSRQTPAYNEEELKSMMNDHLVLTRAEIERYFEGDYEEDIEAFKEAQKEILSMANYLARGLLAR